MNSSVLSRLSQARPSKFTMRWSKWLAVNSFNGYGLDNITFFDTQNCSPKITLADENLNVDQIRFSRKSDLLFTSSINGDLMAWPVENNAHPIVFKAHSTNIREIAMNSQGMLIATCSFDGTVQVWGVPESS